MEISEWMNPRHPRRATGWWEMSFGCPRFSEVLLTSPKLHINKTPSSKGKINHQNVIQHTRLRVVSDSEIKQRQIPGKQCLEPHKSRGFHMSFISLAEPAKLKDIHFHVMFGRTLAASLTRSLKLVGWVGGGWDGTGLFTGCLSSVIPGPQSVVL